VVGHLRHRRAALASSLATAGTHAFADRPDDER
jgi:hypothetical protein